MGVLLKDEASAPSHIPQNHCCYSDGSSLTLSCLTQMTQQMSGMAVSGGGPTPGTFNQSGTPAAGWPAGPPTASGQTLSTQLWKWRGGGGPEDDWGKTWGSHMATKELHLPWTLSFPHSPEQRVHSGGSMTALNVPPYLTMTSHWVESKTEIDWQLSWPVFSQCSSYFLISFCYRLKKEKLKKAKLKKGPGPIPWSVYYSNIVSLPDWIVNS